MCLAPYPVSPLPFILPQRLETRSHRVPCSRCPGGTSGRHWSEGLRPLPLNKHMAIQWPSEAGDLDGRLSRPARPPRTALPAAVGLRPESSPKLASPPRGVGPHPGRRLEDRLQERGAPGGVGAEARSGAGPGLSSADCPGCGVAP